MPIYRSDGRSTQYGTTAIEAAEIARSDAETQAAQRKHIQEISVETDELLDLVDEILEVNAEDVVKTFVQKGGE